MKVTPLAFESMGVRSMATHVEAGGCRITIDPSAALGPLRYGLPPHQMELDALAVAKKRIHDYASKSDILAITHYHYDHHDPGESFYNGKKVLAKDICSMINKSQAERGRYFAQQLPDSRSLEYADGRSFSFGDVKIEFSPPAPHGPPGIRLGYVIMCSISHGNDVLVHASDAQGPVDDAARDWIIDSKPTLLVMDGPPTYFLGYKFSQANLMKAECNLLEILDETGCMLILEHHLLRDLKHRERMPRIYSTGIPRTAAEYVGVEDNLLEARRKELWGK
ncbi:MAG: MBL fold metallo-hydrolase [Candidatus Altiarchaeota archaeon]